MQLELFPDKGDTPVQSSATRFTTAPISLAEIFKAYQSCRRHKRSTTNALAFELDYEYNLVALWEEINNGTYHPGKSIAFIVDKPVKREIFAADFRDRVVHHLIINKLNQFFEKEFIFDSYACRVGKGTHMGIRRIDRFIRQCSQNYTRDCYILKLDIKGFFMSINRGLLFEKLNKSIIEKYHKLDQFLIIDLCRKVIYHDPVNHCIIKGNKSNWDNLPRDKSLFYTPDNCGLPIGNLTSQVFANFYMNSFDHFIKHNLKIRYYGRYVDDFVIIHPVKEYLKSIIPIIREYLYSNLGLVLHPNKIYLQHYSKGLSYLGAVIKSNRIYIGNRTKGNFYQALQIHNETADHHKPDKSEIKSFQSSINSYLGIMKHYKTFNIRKKMLFNILSERLKKLFRTNIKLEKVIIKK